MRSSRSLLFSFFLLLGVLSTLSNSKAIETVLNGSNSFNTTNNISSSVSSWSTGWGTGGDGWNYFGQIYANGITSSGVYLGNGWVLTVGHVGVGSGSFTLNGQIYDTNGYSFSNFTNASTGTNTADLALFQISTTSTTGYNLSLSSLTLTTSEPANFTTVVMIGNGGGYESWGTNALRQSFPSQGITNPVSVTDHGLSFETIDFFTGPTSGAYGAVVAGDSGGGDFVKVGTTWELAGLNEASYGSGYSAFVNLSAYYTQITNNMATPVPEPSPGLLAGLGFVFLLTVTLLRRYRLQNA